jgi:hypothetical protein
MSFYTRTAATSLRMLTKYGQSFTFRPYSQGGGDYNPSTGVGAPSGIAGQNDSTRMGLATDAPGKRIGPEYGNTLENGTLIQDSDKWLYIDANGAKPSLQDHIIWNSTEYSIIDVQEVSPAGTAVLYLVVLRA